MEFRNKKTWRLDPFEGYLVALVAFALAFLIRRQLQGLLDDALPTFFFQIAAILVAARYGFGPALLTMGLSLPVSLFFFVQPYDVFEKPTFRDTLTILYFTSVTFLVAIALEMAHRSRYNSELNARVSDSRYRLMVQMDREMKQRPVATTGGHQGDAAVASTTAV